MAYIGRQQDGFGVRSRFIFTATGGQTTFTTDDSSNLLSYSDGAYVDVYLNGVLLDPSDYTATSLTSIVLDSGATASDILEVIVYDVFSVFSGTFTNGITANTATITGDLTVDTGNLLVGTTDTNPSNNGASGDAGVAVGNIGYVSAARSSESVGLFNRMDSDGDILLLRKDGSDVGSIGVDFTDNLFISGNSSHAGVTFGTASIVPYKNGAVLADGLDLGSSAGRFRDLYLGGGAYIGGTGSANYLDDYEEGTWTPTLPSAWATGITTYDAHYTKIGNLVHITMWVAVSGITGTFTANIGGLPFTAHAGYGNLGTALVYSGASTAITRTYLGQNSTAFNLLNNSANFSTASNTQVGASNIMANFTYRV